MTSGPRKGNNFFATSCSMIFGIGIDIIEVDRMAQTLSKFGPSFVERIFGEKEKIYSGEKGGAAAHFAARFAAKEAFFKALGLGLRKGVQWKEIEVITDEVGRPFLEIRGKAREIFEGLGLRKAFLSMAHEKKYAVAFVVIEA